ncbi:30S ribosomal protein S8 [Candidatus Tremblaya princeps]|uniref:Small ribosomal subunit protein uS8 n=1 Tax=Tremblaya princeps TaxID=189385 RepID=A0A143WNN6_TREPR|nr:30S ribosomal protein S8 [Candidatus Tremblaya princeps]
MSDTLAHIRNSVAARRRTVRLRMSSASVSLARALHRAGYASGFSVTSTLAQGSRLPRWVHLELRRGDSPPAMREVALASRPGLRMHARVASLRRYRYGHGAAILSTSKGMITDRLAQRLGIGGEVVCHVL